MMEWIGIGVSFLMGLSALLVGLRALRKDEKSNRIAQEALDLARMKNKRVEFEVFTIATHQFGARNVGPGIAYYVSVTGHNTQMDHSDPLPRLLPGEAITFRCHNILGSPAEPTLTWHQRSDSDPSDDHDAHVWRITLPSNGW